MMHKWGLSTAALVLVAILSLMTPPARSQKTPPTKSRPAASDAWVEQTLKKMTLREKLGQLLMVSFFGVFDSAESPEYKEVLREVEENHVGGLIIVTDRGPLGIERSQVYPTAVVTNELQRRAKVPLLVGADFETGTGMRLDEGTSFPSAMAIAATGDPKLAYAAGKYTALEARAAGVQWVFAPDADVNDNPDNPIINIRSFGEDPATRRNIRQGIRARRRRQRRARDGETFPRPRQRQRGFAYLARYGPGQPQGSRKQRTRALSRGDRRGSQFHHAGPSGRSGI